MRNLFLFLFLLSTYSAVGQFGIKAGVNLSNITTSDDDIDDLKAKIGFQAGAMLKIPLSETFAIQPEVLYTRKGSDYKYLGSDVTSNLDYLDIPVLVMLQPSSIPLQIYAGPQFSYLLRTDVLIENAIFTTENSYEVERENFEDYDFGIVAGLGFKIGNAMLDLRYSKGLKEYEKETPIGTATFTPSSKHFNLQASIGVYF